MKKGVDVAVILQKLPEICASFLPSDHSAILIRRGEQGYHPAPGLDVVAYNSGKGITAAQVEAMVVGSMFGWSAPGANPDNCDGQTALQSV